MKSEKDCLCVNCGHELGQSSGTEADQKGRTTHLHKHGTDNREVSTACLSGDCLCSKPASK